MLFFQYQQRHIPLLVVHLMFIKQVSFCFILHNISACDGCYHARTKTYCKYHCIWFARCKAMVWTDIAFILFSKISLGLNYFPLTYTRQWIQSSWPNFFLITHNQQVNPINEINFTHKCQENWNYHFLIWQLPVECGYSKTFLNILLIFQKYISLVFYQDSFLYQFLLVYSH